VEREHNGTPSQNLVECDPGELGAPTNINLSLLLATRTLPQRRERGTREEARTESEKKAGWGQGGGDGRAWATAISCKFAWSPGH